MRIEYTTKLIMQEDLHSLYEILGWNNFLRLNQEQIGKSNGTKLVCNLCL